MTGRVIVFLIGVGLGTLSFAVFFNPGLIRIVVAVLIGGALVIVSLRNPQAGAVLALSLLPGLGLLRRVLIPLAGWTPYDGLLLVAPIVSIVIAHRLFIIERRPIAKDGLSKLVVVLLTLALLETANPAGGGLVSGLTGLLFVAVPLIWFFVGREIANRRTMNILMACTAVAGLTTAAYGLLQEQVGLPNWDAAWVAINSSSYAALSVAGATRAFGTLSSSAEYATFVATALVMTIVGILFGRRRWLLLLPGVPLLAYALFLESSRGIVILLLLATVVVLGMRTGNLAITLLFVAIAAGAAWATVQFYGPRLTQMAQLSGNPFIAHQVAGLMNPFDPAQSTYQLHQQIAVGGLVTSVHHPLGFGTASTNLAGYRLSSTTAGTEVDLTNAFVGLGLPGGVIFSALLVITLWRAAALGLSTRNVAALAAMGLLVVTLGQWMNGGYYAIAPLVWFVIGWTSRTWLVRRARDAERAAQRRAMLRVGPVSESGWLPAAVS